jgi:drug/metabolite transporter (DMT)-like permease
VHRPVAIFAACGDARLALVEQASSAHFAAGVFASIPSRASNAADFLMQAGFTLAYVTVFQTIAMALWMIWREPDQLAASLASWRSAVWVGLSGVAGSAGWFTAMTLQQVAYVRALAQIELVFTFLVSWLVFHESVRRSEAFGALLIIAGIVVLLLGV